LQAELTPRSVEFCCPSCEEAFALAVESSDGQPGPPACPGCGFRATVAEGAPRTPAPASAHALERCWICGTHGFYVQKDFNRQLGFGIVVTSFLAVFLVMALVDHLSGLYLLFVVAVADWVVYRLVRNVTVCYLCHAIYRRFPLGAELRGFDLEQEEKFKQRRREWVEAMGLGDGARAAEASS